MIYDAIIIVQARMESTRLPGKVLMKLNTKPLIIHLLERLQRIPTKKLIVAISNDEKSKPLYETLINNAFNVYQGHPTNVYERFLNALQHENAAALVRVTADNPLTDLNGIKFGIEKLINEKIDYLWMDNCPKGLGCDIFNMNTFKSFANQKLTSLEKEHIVPIFRNRPHLKGDSIKMNFPENFKNLNFSIDTKDEYDYVNSIFNQLGEKISLMDTQEIIKHQIK